MSTFFNPLRINVLCITVVAWMLLISISGCGKETLDFIETKRISEKVTKKEMQAFLRVIHSLPSKKLPDYPSVYAPPPGWEADRTLPVSELVFEERNMISQRWETKWLASHLPQSRALNRALKRQKMTREQFISLATAIGIALSRNQITPHEDLAETQRIGTVAIAKLNKNQKSFSKHSLDEQHDILNQAVWIIRVDRANHLLLVPPENIALVKKHSAELKKIFPEEYIINPFERIADLLHEQGLPFEETLQSGSDAEIDWDRETAIIGNDS